SGEGARKVALLINLGFCLENLGDLKTALQHQLHGREAARASGDIGAQIWAVNNIGAIKTKFGDVREAADILKEALTLKEVNAGNIIDQNSLSFTIEADIGINAAYRGDYRLASECIKHIRITDRSAFDMNRMLCEIIRCKFFIEIGETSKVLE